MANETNSNDPLDEALAAAAGQEAASETPSGEDHAAQDQAEETVAFGPAAEPTAEDQLAEAQDRTLRLQAELQNVLNRTRREVAEERKYGALGIARDLLPAIDNIDRALAAGNSADDEADPASLATGIKMVREQLIGVLDQHGCKPIPTDPGTEFDPNFHEAILQQPSEDVPAGTVLMAAQSGYKLHDRVVRAAQVIVSTGPAEG